MVERNGSGILNKKAINNLTGHENEIFLHLKYIHWQRTTISYTFHTKINMENSLRWPPIAILNYFHTISFWIISVHEFKDFPKNRRYPNASRVTSVSHFAQFTILLSKFRNMEILTEFPPSGIGLQQQQPRQPVPVNPRRHYVPFLLNRVPPKLKILEKNYFMIK